MLLKFINKTHYHYRLIMIMSLKQPKRWEISFIWPNDFDATIYMVLIQKILMEILFGVSFGKLYMRINENCFRQNISS